MTRRRLAGVTPQDRSTAGRPRLYGYGYGWIAAAAGCTRAVVRQAVSEGGLDPSDPARALAWVLDRLGERELAHKLKCIADVAGPAM